MGRKNTHRDELLKVVTVGGDIVAHPPCYSPDSKYLITACDKHINVYSTTTGDTVSKLSGHKDRVTTLFLNPFNDLQLYTISLDKTIRLWDYEEGKILLQISVSREIFAAVPSPTTEGVIYVVYNHNEPKVDRTHADIYEIYIGVSPRNVSNQSTRNALGREAESAQDDFNTPYEAAKSAVLGTGIFDLEGNEILKSNNWSEEKTTRKIRKRRLKSDHYPAKVTNFDGIQIFKEEIYLFSVKQHVTNLLINKFYLFYVTENAISTYDYQARKHAFSRFEVNVAIHSAVVHPTEDVLAIGVKSGIIHLWRYSASGQGGNLQEKHHWHIAKCSALQFTEDGTYLLSGGTEGVLVIWQLETGRKQFIPGLGAPIISIAVSPDAKYYAVSTLGNCIHLINSMSARVHRTITSLVYVSESNTKEASRTTFSKLIDNSQLLVEPREGLLVAQGSPGVLQFYNPITDQHVSSLVVARNHHGLLHACIANITHFCFSKDGNWLITVDCRQIPGEEPRSLETFVTLKFWRYSSIAQTFELTTEVYPPHEEFTSMAICPVTNRVVTTGKEGKFAIWSVVSVKNGSKENASWRCSSIGYYRTQEASASSFSSDGSLLAVSYGTTVTLWDPNTIVLKKTLKFSDAPVSLLHVAFVSNSPYLLAASKTHLYVWNLLTLRIHWYSELSEIHSVAVDPVQPKFAVLVKKDTSQSLRLPCPGDSKPYELPKFIVEKLGLENLNSDLALPKPMEKKSNFKPKQTSKTNGTTKSYGPKKRPPTIAGEIRPDFFLFAFQASSHNPLSVTRTSYIPRSEITFLPNKDFTSNSQLANIGYLSRLSIVIIGEPSFIDECQKRAICTGGSEPSKQKSIFSEVYGELKEATMQAGDETTEKSSLSSNSKALSVLDSPSHLIPSVNILFSTFMDSLLTKSETPISPEDNNDTTDVTNMDVDMEEPISIDTPTQTIEKEIFSNFNLHNDSTYASLMKKISSVSLSNQEPGTK